MWSSRDLKARCRLVRLVIRYTLLTGWQNRNQMTKRLALITAAVIESGVASTSPWLQSAGGLLRASKGACVKCRFAGSWFCQETASGFGPCRPAASAGFAILGFWCSASRSWSRARGLFRAPLQAASRARRSATRHPYRLLRLIAVSRPAVSLRRIIGTDSLPAPPATQPLRP